MKEYSVVISAYNESDKITATLTQISSFMSTFAESYEIVVVDDGSTDPTAQKVAEYAQSNDKIVLIKNVHKGKGVGLWTGVMKAEGQYIYLCDADLSTPISEIKKMSVWIKDHNFDIVIGSREAPGAQRINEPAYRHLMGRVFNLVVQVIALPGFKDSQCGFKLLKAEVAKTLFSKLRVYSAQKEAITVPYLGAYDVEMLYIARKMGFKIKEVGVVWKFVKTTRLNPLRDALKMTRDVLQIRVNDLKGKYL